MFKPVKRFSLSVLLVGAVAGLSIIVLGASGGGAEHVRGTHAADLNAGSMVFAKVPLKPGQSYTIGLVTFKNQGRAPARIEEVQPESSSSSLTATPGRIWVAPANARWYLPVGWPGWPPHNLPKSSRRILAGRSLVSLPTRLTVPPGRYAQVVYGISLHASPSPKIEITDLRITFEQGGHDYVWTLPEPVHLYPRP